MDTTDSDSLVLNKKLQYLKMKASVSIYEAQCVVFTGAIACCFDLLCSGLVRVGHVLFLSVLPRRQCIHDANVSLQFNPLPTYSTIVGVYSDSIHYPF